MTGLAHLLNGLKDGGPVILAIAALAMSGFTVGLYQYLGTAAEPQSRAERGREAARTRRGLAFIAMLAGLAPLLGLLGTVFGLVQTFRGLGSGGSDSMEVSGGIAQALTATESGLAVAIPLVLLHHWLRGRAERNARVEERRG